MEDDGVVEYCEYRVKPKLLTGDLESVLVKWALSSEIAIPP